MSFNRQSIQSAVDRRNDRLCAQRATDREPSAALPTSSLELLAVHIENTIRAAIGTEGARSFLPALHDAQDAIRSELSRRGDA
jgi:hypothetical protein